MKSITIKGFARIAAQTCCLCFIVAIACLSVALAVRPLAIVGLGALVLPVVGFFSGSITLVAAGKAQAKDISAAFGGMALNALMVFGLFYVAGEPCHGSSPTSACLFNLKDIEMAKSIWALEHQKSTNDSPADSDLFGENSYIRRKPECPAGGIYRLGSARVKATCSVPGHLLP